MKSYIPILLSLLLVGCPSTPEAEPEYDRPLPAGKSALVRIYPGELIPSVKVAYEHRNEQLLAAIDQSLLWFMAPSTQKFFPFEDICTHEQAQASVIAFRELLLSGLSPDEFERELWRRFEMYRSVGWNGQGTVLFTGYYAPEFRASRTKAPGFDHPLYRRPPDLVTDPDTGRPLGQRTPTGKIASYPTRREIEEGNLLAGTELVWLEDEFATYIVQVNGSAKLKLADGSTIHVGYDGKTDREYKGLGTMAVEEGLVAPENLNLPALTEAWRRNPALVRKLMYGNESYVFFTEYDGGNWPAGSLGVQVTPQASLATDKKIYPRGGVVLVHTTLMSTTRGRPEFLRFMLDQDTGGAIRAPGRADIFMGVGPAAETLAGGQYAEGALYYYILKPELMPQYLEGDNVLKPETAMLNVIDVQGRLAEIVADSENVRKNIVRLIEGTRLFSMPLLATEQVPEKLGATVPDVQTALGEGDLPTKETFSCWQDGEMREAYAATGRKQILVCGIECHVCVYQTVRDLLAADYEVHLVVDAVSSRNPQNRDVAIRRMERMGAKLTTTEMALFELKFDCTGETFRKLSKLVK